MRVLIAPDSFKGSLSAMDVAKTVTEAAAMEWPELECTTAPLADGGEGTMDALVMATGGQRIPAKVTGPLGNQILTHYGVLGDHQTVVLEIANVAGFAMIPDQSRNPHLHTTYGLGELFIAALENGYRQFIIGLGGSATNDGGVGFLQALGAEFYDIDDCKTGVEGQAIFKVQKADFSNLDERLKTCSIIVASDVNNPLCGLNGATAIYGPQKGIEKTEILMWDTAMQRYATIIEKEVNRTLQHEPGAGTAGGMGFAAMVIGAKRKSGAELVGSFLNLEEKISQSTFVITAEGRTDEQTIKGKLPFYVAQIAAKHRVPVIVLSGSIDPNIEKLTDVFVSLHSIIPAPLPIKEAMENARPLLLHAARQMFRTMRMIWKLSK